MTKSPNRDDRGYDAVIGELQHRKKAARAAPQRSLRGRELTGSLTTFNSATSGGNPIGVLNGDYYVVSTGHQVNRYMQATSLLITTHKTSHPRTQLQYYARSVLYTLGEKILETGLRKPFGTIWRPNSRNRMCLYSSDWVVPERVRSVSSSRQITATSKSECSGVNNKSLTP